jgi:putative acetyltransferase
MHPNLSPARLPCPDTTGIAGQPFDEVAVNRSRIERRRSRQHRVSTSRVTTIRQETAADRAAVADLLTAAFGADQVARLVDLIRRSEYAEPELGFVATGTDGAIVGYVLFSRAPLRRPDADDVEVLLLSPLAVHPDQQRQGIGAALVRHGLDEVNARREPLIILEGAPALYRRFGFERASDHGILRPSDRIPEAAFQIRRLDAYDAGLTGTIEYPSAFWETDSIGP